MPKNPKPAVEPKPASPAEPELKSKIDFGRLHPKESLILREHVGEANLEKLSYEMAVSLPQMTPVVRSKQTGKWFNLPWQHIVDMAVKAGIDDP